MSADPGSLPDALRLLRQARQLTLGDLESATGIHRARIYAYECGSRKASFSVLHRLTRGMGLTLSALEVASAFLLTLHRLAAEGAKL